MAKILAFRSMEFKREGANGHSRKQLAGQVILFPGVRYERWSGHERQRAREDATSKKRENTRQRDVLELAE